MVDLHACIFWQLTAASAVLKRASKGEIEGRHNTDRGPTGNGKRFPGSGQDADSPHTKGTQFQTGCIQKIKKRLESRQRTSKGQIEDRQKASRQQTESKQTTDRKQADNRQKASRGKI
jgi:hypothetical protein